MTETGRPAPSSPPKAALFVPVCSIARTKRGRYFWAAWWTGTPIPSGDSALGENPDSVPRRAEQFRKPDGSGGGLRSHAEAFQAAARAAAGKFPGDPAAHRGGAAEASLIEIDARWANAWLRILADLPPFPKPKAPAESKAAPAAIDDSKVQNPSLWEILGISSKATLEDVKAAYRKRALETHPDHGGDPSAFRALVRAYQMALLRRR